jgi:hypothetical protein
MDVTLLLPTSGRLDDEPASRAVLGSLEFDRDGAMNATWSRTICGVILVDDALVEGSNRIAYSHGVSTDSINGDAGVNLPWCWTTLSRSPPILPLRHLCLYPAVPFRISHR